MLSERPEEGFLLAVKKKVARDVTATALLNQCPPRGAGNEGQKCSSLLKDTTTAWYLGWGSLPPDEAQKDTRAFRARHGTAKTQSGQPRQILLLFHVEW